MMLFALQRSYSPLSPSISPFQINSLSSFPLHLPSLPCYQHQIFNPLSTFIGHGTLPQGHTKRLMVVWWVSLPRSLLKNKYRLFVAGKRSEHTFKGKVRRTTNTLLLCRRILCMGASRWRVNVRALVVSCPQVIPHTQACIFFFLIGCAKYFLVLPTALFI